MEQTEQLPTCHFCDAALNNEWYKLKGCRYVADKVVIDFYYRLCQDCYPNVQYTVKLALNRLLKHLVQEAMTKLKQEVLAAGKI